MSMINHPITVSSRRAVWLGPRVHPLALAIALGLATVSSSVMSSMLAHAESADPGVRCAAKTGPGQYEFYLPGEKATDTSGQRWVCGPDGQWFRDYSAAIQPSNPTTPPVRFPVRQLTPGTSSTSSVLTR